MQVYVSTVLNKRFLFTQDQVQYLIKIFHFLGGGVRFFFFAKMQCTPPFSPFQSYFQITYVKFLFYCVFVRKVTRMHIHFFTRQF